MKLCLLTYNMARHWELSELIRIARLGGFSGLELRAEAGHKHGVELETSAEERRSIRYQVQDGCLEVAGISTSSRFESPDATKRREVVERSKRYIELAADINAGQIRVFGNDMPKEGVDGGSPPPREDVMRYVGDSLRELGEFAEPHAVFEMGQKRLQRLDRIRLPARGQLEVFELLGLLPGCAEVIHETARRLRAPSLALFRRANDHALRADFPVIRMPKSIVHGVTDFPLARMRLPILAEDVC